ncbi:hypothetical protein EON81_12775 [bacterium]|nr:MAG: hypothetical protein EON81_12775 [bacterium]
MNLRILFSGALLLGLALAALLFLFGGRAPRLHVRLPWLRLCLRAGRVRQSEIPGGVPISVATFLMGFGASGLIFSDSLRASPVVSILGAVALGGVLRLAVVLSLRRLVGGEAVAMEGGTIVGTVCRVSLAIPADGVGAVAYHAEGKRHTMAARSADAHPLSADSRVLVTDLRKGVALVEEF